MFQVSLYGVPTPKTDADKGKKKSKRERLTRLARFTVETDNSAEVTKVVANTLSKLPTAKQVAVVSIDIRQVAKPDLNAPLF